LPVISPTRPAQAAPAPGKRSALGAAARVSAKAGAAMTCPKMIAAMAAQGYWTGPGGKTPAATLHSAILKEIQTKGAQSRSTKTERGKFGLAACGWGAASAHTSPGRPPRFGGLSALG